MLVNWTNHLGENIVNHNSEPIEFEQVILKFLSAQGFINIDAASGQTKHRYLAASSEIANALLANDVRERGSDVDLLYFSGNKKWKNQDGEVFINHLNEPLYFRKGLIDAEQTRFRYLANNVNYDLSTNIEQSRERSIDAATEIEYSMTSKQLREKVLAAAATITVRLVSAIKKFYGYWATIMVKIKE